jgi:prepilin-type N-terminal cleavage/methylation domain-containing protein
MRSRSEAGMTLIEVLVSVTILGVIVGPLTSSIILGLVSTKATDQRISDSSSAQLLSSYLVPDVQAAESIYTSSGFLCSPRGAQSDGSTITPVLETHWKDPVVLAGVEVDTPKAAAYAIRNPGNGQDSELRRFTCSGSALMLDSSVGQFLVRSVSSATPNCSPTPPPACLARFTSLTLSVTTAGTNAQKGITYYAPYTFTITADRRVT